MLRQGSTALSSQEYTHYMTNKEYKRRTVDLAFAARERAPLAIERLTRIVAHGDDRDAINAAKILLDRGYGRAPIQIDVTQGLKGDSLIAVAEAIIARRKLAGTPPEGTPPGGISRLTGVGGAPGSPHNIGSGEIINDKADCFIDMIDNDDD